MEPDVRQRNDTSDTVSVMVWPTEEYPDQYPRDVAPGEVTDLPTLLAGFTPVEDKKPPAVRKTATAVPAQTEGVES